MKNIGLYFLSSILCLSAILGGCSDDNMDIPQEAAVPEEGETTIVPLTISFDAGWQTDAATGWRTAPPGAGSDLSGSNVDAGDSGLSSYGREEYKDVNTVEVFTFRRKAVDDSSDNPFRFDKSNHKLIPAPAESEPELDDQFGDREWHKVFKETITKVYGYEYRIMAIAYSTSSPTSFMDFSDGTSGQPLNGMGIGDGGRFRIPDMDDSKTIEDFYAEMTVVSPGFSDGGWTDFFVPSLANIPKEVDHLTRKAAEPPQLFYGECFTEWGGNRQEVIPYSVTNEAGDEKTDLKITGILFRGMAKVEVHVIPTPHVVTIAGSSSYYYPTNVSLLAETVYTKAGLTDYDDFLKPYSPVSAHKDGGTYTAIAYLNGILDKAKKREKIILTAYLLPCVTRLGLRIKKERLQGLGSDYSDSNIIRNAQLYPSDQDYDRPNGTGIISPDSHDGLFYLRRNHKYVLYVSDSEKLLKERAL